MGREEGVCLGAPSERAVEAPLTYSAGTMPRPKLLLVLLWALVCGGAFLMWQGPASLTPPTPHHPSSAPPYRAPTGGVARAHVSNPRYLRIGQGRDGPDGTPPSQPPTATGPLADEGGRGGEDSEEEDGAEGEEPAGDTDGPPVGAAKRKKLTVDTEEDEDNDIKKDHKDKELDERETLAEEEEGIGGVGVAETGAHHNATPDASLLVYNRIPKCASSTMQTILRRLSRHLGFTHISSLVYNQHQLTTGDQRRLVDQLTNALHLAPDATLSYDRHLYYTNFTKYGGVAPVYVNIVRDPVERFISSFYYRRSQERLNRIQAQPSPRWVNRTVEQCVVAGDSECQFQDGDEKEMILTYFCGHKDLCRVVGHPEALQMAKQVVSQEYSVVGLLEHIEVSLGLMETLMPRFMSGAMDVYRSIKQREHMIVNKNSEKPEVSAAVRETLRKRMSDDYDFYYFLKQRLYQQRKIFLGDDAGNL